jgi:hypothetical protein
MAGKAYREPINVIRITTASDGGFGNTNSSESNLYTEQLAWVTEKPSNPLYVDTQKFKYSKSFSFIHDASIEIAMGDLVNFRGKRLSIQSIEFSDTGREILIRTLS